jgi:cytochrome c biogenesis protein CcmG/thiol:disulfide interchange protein DsbE
VAVVVGVLASLLVGVLATRPSVLDRQTRTPLLGHAAPPIAGDSVTEAPFASLSAWRGRWVIVNFFATWCVPCRREHPELIRFTQSHQAAADVGLVMVIYADTPSEVQSFFRTSGGDWPAVADPGGRVALDYGVSGVPETYVIDPIGTMVAKIVGGITADGLDRLLNATRVRA